MPAFISYVREDARLVDHLVQIIRENGVEVFLDRDSIEPGSRWKDAIKKAIKSGDYFLAIFSASHEARAASYANEELIQAVEMLRTMPRDRQWLIPIKIDQCAIPEIPIGVGETLQDLNWISLPDEGYPNAMQRLLRTIGVEDPVTDFGEPIASGYGSKFDLVSGTINYEAIEMPGSGAQLDGMVFHVTGGWCARQPEGHLAAQIIVSAPNKSLEDLNRLLGLNKFFAVADATITSLSAKEPTDFFYKREYVLPKGTTIPAMFGQPASSLTTDMPFVSSYIAKGQLADGRFFGEWQGGLEFDVMGSKLNIPMRGSFDVGVR